MIGLDGFREENMYEGCIFSLSQGRGEKREREEDGKLQALLSETRPCFFLKVQVGPILGSNIPFWAHFSLSQSNYTDIKAHITLTSPFTRKSKAHMPSSPTTAVEPGDDDFLMPDSCLPSLPYLYFSF